MMDIYLYGGIGSALGILLGPYLARFRRFTVAILGFSFGVLINLIFVLYRIISGSSIRVLGTEMIVAIERHGLADFLFSVLILPCIFMVVFSLMRVFSVPPTAEEAQDALVRKGFEKSVHEGGRRVVLVKGEVSVVFRHDRRYGPPRAERWKNGKRKGDVLLRVPVD